MAEQAREHHGCRGRLTEGSMERMVMMVGGAEIRFRFDLEAWCEIEDEIGSLDALTDRLDKNDRPTQASIALIAATINAGKRHAGETDRIDADWVRRSMSPKQFKLANALARQAFVIGMRRDEAQDEDEDVDVVAQEIKKKEAGAAHANA